MLDSVFFTSNTMAFFLTEIKCITYLKEAIKSLHYWLKPNLKIPIILHKCIQCNLI